MSDALRNLTRKQLGDFLPDPRSVRAFEQLLKQLADLIPADLENLSNSVTAAQITANQAKIAADAAQQNAELAEEGVTLASQALAMLAQMAGLTYVETLPAQHSHVIDEPITPPSGPITWGEVLNQPRIEAFDSSASIALTATHALLKPASQLNAKGITYDASTGVFTFMDAGCYSLSLSVNATASASNQFVYIYAENSFDGTTWTVNANSGKFYELNNANTVQIVYSQTVSRIAGQQVRYQIYSNSNKVNLVTQTLPGSVGVIVPAIRIQYSS